MSLGLTKPGASVVLRHPKTGRVIEPIGYVRGKAVWPVLGASSDDEDDPAYQDDGGEGSAGRSRFEEDDEDDSNNDEDDEDEKPRRKSKADEDDEDDQRLLKASRQAKRYRLQLRDAQAKNAELEERLAAIEDSDKPQDEILKRDLEKITQKADSLVEVNRILTSQLAFFKSNTVEWIDPNDAFALAEREGLFDELVDEDGNVDSRELRRGLKDLAKRKPHLVKKATSGRETEDNEEPRSRSSASTMNSQRRGQHKDTPSRDKLAGRFPVLRRG